MLMGLVHSRSTVRSSNIQFQFTPRYRWKVFENEKVGEVCEQGRALKNIKPFSYSIFDKRQKTLANFSIS